VVACVRYLREGIVYERPVGVLVLLAVMGGSQPCGDRGAFWVARGRVG